MSAPFARRCCWRSRTTSSEAAFPKTLKQLENFGIANRIASFVLPLGYSFNLDGSMMYCSFATMFIAQAYGIHLSIGQQFTMLLILMVTSKGIAGVPRASFVVIAATLSSFNLPEAGLLLILAVDHFLDMGRAATNVVGNSVATAVVAQWENEIVAPVVGRGDLFRSHSCEQRRDRHIEFGAAIEERQFDQARGADNVPHPTTATASPPRRWSRRSRADRRQSRPVCRPRPHRPGSR